MLLSFKISKSMVLKVGKLGIHWQWLKTWFGEFCNMWDIFKYFIYLFLERGEGREKEMEGNIDVWWSVASHMPPAGYLACNPGMCPDWELSQPPFGSQAGTQSTEPHQWGQYLGYFKRLLVLPILSDKWTCICVKSCNTFSSFLFKEKINT